ncbi:MAG: C-terminal target protein [Bacteroidota bacterium]|nr:C-terminal target protein [Bacteroidota bacterium]
MKKLFTVFLSFTSLVCFSQRLVEEVCLGTPNSDLIVGFHENNDSTTTIIKTLQTYDTLGVPYFTYELLKLDKSMHLVYSKKLDLIVSLNNNSWASSVLTDADGSMLIFGMVNPLASKYDPNGNFLWKADSIELINTYGSINAIQKPDGGYIFYNGTGPERDILSVSNTGHFIWRKHFSLTDILSQDISNQHFLSVTPLFNNKTLVTGTIKKVTVSGVGFDTIRTVHYLLNSSGAIIATNDQYTLPSLIIPDFSSHHDIVLFGTTQSIPMGGIVLLDPNNLSTVRYDTMIAPIQVNMTTYNKKFEDTSHIYSFHSNWSDYNDSMIYCQDINLNMLWSYRLHHFAYYGRPETTPLLLDNNRIYADRSLIDNGVKIWESNVEVKDTIYYKGKMWFNNSYIIKKDYNGKDISYVLDYADQVCFCLKIETIWLVQIIDIQTGLVKEKTIIDPKPRQSGWLLHYGPGQIFFAASDETPCNYGSDDVYLGYYSGIYNSVYGVAFIDYNNNNVKNAGEPTYPWGYAYTRSARDSQMTHLYSTGQFLFYTDTGNYNTHISLYNDYFTISPAQFNSSHTTYGHADTAYFALHPIPGKNDLEIKLLNNWWTRMGRVNKYTVSLTNKGAFPASGKVKLVLDQRLLSLTATPPPTSMSGDTMIWSITNLPPAQTVSAVLHFTGATPPVLNAGDTLFSQAWIINDSVDIVPADNYTTLKEAVLSSYDPNEKTILSGSNLTPAQIANGDYISYIIHFQNKGNDTAFRIIVVDTLSSNVDLNSLQVIGSSAPYTLEIIQDRILKFTFDNIRLSFDTLALNSTGYIAYKIKAKPTVSLGNTIDNTANIFFDYNAPIRTNTVQTQIVLLSAVKEVKKQNVKMSIYPNPNSGTFTISYENKSKTELRLQLIDITGNIIYEERKHHSDKTEFVLHQNDLAKGIYWIKLNDGNTDYSSAFIVQ